MQTPLASLCSTDIDALDSTVIDIVDVDAVFGLKITPVDIPHVGFTPDANCLGLGCISPETILTRLHWSFISPDPTYPATPPPWST